MQIPGTPPVAALGFLQQPQPGSNRQVNPQLQVKANTAGPVRGRAAAPGLAAALAQAQNLEQAVHALADQGRLPPRGSLIDLSA